MISVCMGTFNGAEFISEQIHSILTQLEANDELVISDDGSSDDTVKIIEAINDTRIVLLKNPRRGVISNFQNALNAAGGEYIFLADQDDIWMSDKVVKMKHYLEQGYDLVVSDCRVMNRDLSQVLIESFFKYRGTSQSLLRNLYKNSFMGCCMAFNRYVLGKALPFPANIPMHDSWIGVVAILIGKVALVDEPLLLHRRHGSNASLTATESRLSLQQKLYWRLGLIASMVSRYKLFILSLKKHFQ